MHIKKTKTKNSEIYYLCKSYRDEASNKVTSKVIEKIGTKPEIQKKIGKNKNVDKWLKEYAKERTAQEVKHKIKVDIKLDLNKKISMNQRNLFNAGFFAIQNICYEIGLDKILTRACRNSNYSKSIFQIVVCMIYNRVINAYDEINTYDYSRTFVYPPKFTKQQLYRAIDVLSENAVFIQTELYKRLKMFRARTDIFYFDRQSFIFDIEQSTVREDWIRKNDLLVDYEVVMDCEGIPVAYMLPLKYINSEPQDYQELQTRTNKDWKDSQLIIFNCDPEEELSKKLIQKFNTCIFANDQEISKLPKPYKSWIMSDDNWNMIDSTKTYNLDEVKAQLTSTQTSYFSFRKLYNSYFYKHKTIKVKNEKSGKTEEKTLVVFFNFELQKIHKDQRLEKIMSIKSRLDKAIVKNLDDVDKSLSKFLNKYSKIISENVDTKDEIKNKYTFKEDVFSYGKEFDGFYALVVDKGVYNIEEIIKVHSYRWQIHQPFEKANAEFKYTPQYLKHESSVAAHFLLCTIMVIVWRLYLTRFKEKSYSWEVADMLSTMNYLQIPGIGWVPAFKNNDIVTLINEISGLDIDYEFVSEKKMKSLYKNPFN